MNDFTKDELEYIHEYIHQYEGRGGNNKAHQILNKIKYMIENHCKSELKSKNKISMNSAMIAPNKWILHFKWDGIEGHRKMLIETEKDGSFSIPRGAVASIRLMCDEFLDEKNYFHKFLNMDNIKKQKSEKIKVIE